MASHPLIYIRADGGGHIATGHFMRTLSIARACQLLGADICYLVSDWESEVLLRSLFDVEGQFQVITLGHPQHLLLDEELPILTKLLQKKKGRLLLVDSYRASTAYFQALSPLIKTAYLDDLQEFFCPVDVLINYDLDPSYDSHLYKNTTLLLGTAYTPLRTQFTHTTYVVREKVEHLLLATGGGDEKNLAASFYLALCHHYPNLTFHIVVGKLSPNKKFLANLATQAKNLILHADVSDMATLMASCDLALSAAGTTLYELCAVGIPTISYSFSANQVPGAMAFAKAQVIPYGGHTADGCVDLLAPQIISGFQRFMTDIQLRQDTAMAMRRLVDGNGSTRIAQVLCCILP